MKDFNGKVAVITGASRGIGRAVAGHLAAAGFEVVVHYGSRSDAADAVLAEIRDAGGKGRTLGFDIADREAAAAALDSDLQAHGAYYGVVLNAGISKDSPLPAMSGADWDSVLHTNLDGFYNILRPVIMPMVRTRQGGRIVSLSSVSGLVGNRGQVNYSAAKAGIIGASKALALELAKRRITVNCVAPRALQVERFLPLSPMRLLVDARGKQLAELVPHARLNSLVERVKKPTALAIIKQVHKEVDAKMVLANQQAEARLQEILTAAEQQMRADLGTELSRLEALRALNPAIREEELEHLRYRIEECAIHIQHANLQLQALRLIITT